MLVLGLDAGGQPKNWLTVEEAIVYHAKGMVVWSLGEVVETLRGGFRNDGTRSQLSTPSIIAIKGDGFNSSRQRRVSLSNRNLFGRDRHVCAYCGKKFSEPHLSRDHIVPVSKGGLNVWTNVVTACKGCNHYKGDSLLENIGMGLLYVPYEPNFNESLILQNRRIVADQMDFLMSGVTKFFIERDKTLGKVNFSCYT